MPELSVNGTRLFYEDSGGSGPPLVLSHGLLLSHRMFEAQVAHLRSRFRCIAYDHRGQGESAAASGRTVTIEQAYEDAVALIEALKVGPCHFAGLSMGGFVGLRLALRRPELLRSLILLDTSADPEPEKSVKQYRLLSWAARIVGVRPLTTKVMSILFGRSFLIDPARAADRARWRKELQRNVRGIYRACNGVFERAGVFDELGRIQTRTVVMVGEEDIATVPAKAERIAGRIPGAKLVRIPRAGHSSPIENPEAVNRAFDEHLAAA